MSERTTHLFEFPASQIAEAARIEAEYHEQRVKHWQGRLEAALAIVEKTISAKLVENEVTGDKQLGVRVDYGDPEAWDEATLADGKVKTHRDQAERFRTDKRVYSTQGDCPYELDIHDVHHFRLGGQARDD